ncbi:MAG: hypothetical protein ABIQ43_08805 [Sphingomonas sp.]
MMRALLMLGVAVLPVPALAQSMPGMPGMKMPAKSAPKPKPAAKPIPRRAPARPAPASKPKPVGETMSGMDMSAASASADAPQPAAPMAGTDLPAAPAPAQPMAGMDMGSDKMPGMDGMAGMAMGSTAFGMGSGTARNPGDDGMMRGLHLTADDWTLMLHGYAWGAYTDQSGPRGDAQAFVMSMAMVEARRDLGSDATLTLRTMLSLDPLTGKRGYPSLLATGETANGVTPLIDRQHPHDLFMELSARVDVPLGKGVSGFVYGGPVAEPALGPSAFMHRNSAKYLPLAPITHHWFDSTHITFGVITVGAYGDRWQIEGSAFRGREPDQDRWDIEAPRLDSWSVRATWNPSAYWSAQASYGRLESPEALEPGIDEARTTASVQYARGGFSALAGFSAKNRLPGRTLTAWIGEANWNLGEHHSLFGRIENVANDELFPDPASPFHDRPFRVTRGELGYAYRLKLIGPIEAAIGGSGFVVGAPRVLDGAYGKSPVGWTGFVKLSLGG